MRILLDECLGAPTRAALVDLGAAVRWIGDVAPGMSDPEVLALSVTEKRLIVTMDMHFGRLVFKNGQPYWGVLVVREGSAVGAEKSAVVSRIVATEGEALVGAFSTYRRGLLRVHRPGLPRRDVEV